MTPTIPLSAAARRTGEPSISVLMQLALANPNLISLAAGFVDQASLPVEAAASTIAEVLADPIEARRALQYGTTRGDLLFRSRLLERLEREEHVAPGAFSEALPRVVVTTGSQQLLYLVAEALLDPGDIVIVEEPTYFVFLNLLTTRGAVAVGVPTDDGGMKLDALDATLRDLDSQGRLDRVKLIYTISEHGNPSGLSLAPDRRGPLVALAEKWSKEHRIFILEDAAYRGLTFSGTEPASVWRHDATGRSVILARTFSKTFSPGVKTGFGVVPEALVAPILALKTNHDFGSSHFHQQFLERVMADGSYDRQITRLVDVYRRKRDVVLGALDEHLGPLEREGSVSWTRPNGGIYVWLTLPEGLDAGPDGPLFERCVERGVLYVPGAYAFPADGARPNANHIRLCYGVPGEAELAEGVARLAAALEDCLDPVA